MKQVKSKLTGDIGEIDFDSKEGLIVVIYYDLKTKEKVKAYYKRLEDLCDEWEDMPEEPKSTINDVWFNSTVAEGHFVEIDFISYEEAELAVRKLKAWKRLEDKGFRFILDGETEMPMFVYSGANGEKCITSAKESKQCRNDIKLLFGGEE